MADTRVEVREPYRSWTEIGKAVPLWRFILSAFVASWALTSPNNLLIAIRGGWIGRRIDVILAGASDREVDALITVARLNQDRLSYLARLALLAYVTVPLTIVAIAAQVSGSGFMEIARASSDGFGSVIGGFIGGAGGALLGVYVGEARARTMLILLELVAAERRMTEPARPAPRRRKAPAKAEATA